MADDILATPPVLRFAPSPNGALHLGHAYSALMNERLAAETGGRLLLRIEDLDRARCKPEFEAAIVDDLAWLGLRFPAPWRRQSEHRDDYAAALARLDGAGPRLPLLLHALRGRARRRRRSRSGRRAALSWNLPRARPCRSARPPRARRQGGVPPRHAPRARGRAGGSLLGRIWRRRRSVRARRGAGGLGRRRPQRPRPGGELPSRGGRRRRAARRERRRARPRSLCRDRRPPAASGASRPTRRRATGTTGSCSTATARNCRKAVSRNRSPSCAEQAWTQATSGRRWDSERPRPARLRSRSAEAAPWRRSSASPRPPSPPPRATGP